MVFDGTVPCKKRNAEAVVVAGKGTGLDWTGLDWKRMLMKLSARSCLEIRMQDQVRV